MSIAIAKELKLPIDVVTQTLGAIGRKGAGKTYLATMLAEQMLDAGAQVVALDPVGNWFGLRVGADGKSKGKDIFVLGGDHGDVPLTPESGTKIAKLIVEKNVSAVLDISGFRIGERKRFAADFGEELLHAKKAHRTPVHLFIEEAQLLIPQRAGPDEARMLGAYEHIVRLGRNYGIGCTLVTQRPQSVNKEALNQIECLCVLQLTGPQERKAIEGWVQEAGADRALIGELPGLARGEGYVWSPSWLRKYVRVHFSKKTTFDASATPEVGKAERAAVLSAVDVEKIHQDLADVVDQVAKDDPKLLRKRIAELEREIGKKRIDTGRVEVPVLKEQDWKRIEKLTERLAQIASDYAEKQKAIIGALAGIRKAAQAPAQRLHVAKVETIRDPAFGDNVATLVHCTPTNGTVLPKGERAILTAIAQHAAGVTREQLTVLTGYKRSSRDTYLQRLRQLNFVAEDPHSRIVATDRGTTALGSSFAPLPTGAELRNHWLRRLPAGERSILEILVSKYPEAVDRSRLDDVTGYRRSSRDTYLQRLRSRQLVVDLGGGQVRAHEELFS